MTGFDYIVLVIIGLSVLLSMMRGGLREVLALAGWVVAFYVGRTYTSLLIPLLPTSIPTESLKVLAAFLILFLATLLVTSLISITLSQLLKKIGLGWFNRFFGGLFGLVRGLIIVAVLVLLAGLTNIPKDLMWRNAMFSAPLEAFVLTCLPWMPQSIAKHVKYE